MPCLSVESKQLDQLHLQQKSESLKQSSDANNPRVGISETKMVRARLIISSTRLALERSINAFAVTLQS